MSGATFSPTQRAVVASICDTFFPRLSDEDTEDIVQEDKAFQKRSGLDYTEERKILVTQWCKRKATDIATDVKVEELLFKNIPSDVITQTKLLLSALSTSLGTLALSMGKYFSPFVELPLNSRVDILSNFSRSWIPDLRKGFNSLKSIISLCFLSAIPPNTDSVSIEKNPSWPVLKYDRPIPFSLVREQRERHGRDDFEFKMLNNSLVHDDMVDNNEGGLVEIETDVVIVGTGCGGSVLASVLSEIDGLRVLVLEKAQYLRWQEIKGTEDHGFKKMYERGGILVTEDTGIGVLAGSAFGGGTAINWACSLRTPSFVREEWEHLGLRRFGPSSTPFSKAIEYVCNRIGVREGSDVAHNPTNSLFLEGCKLCGYSAEVTGQNMKDTSRRTIGAGDISVGDRFGLKNSTPETFLRDAANNGCNFIDQCYVETIIHDGKRAFGVAGKFTAKNSDGKSVERRIRINAHKAVVLSCGAINTPAMLLRSRVPNSNTLIGKNLRLHPVVGCVATLPRDIRAWNGAPMTTVSNAASGGADGSHYGVKLECPSVHPGIGGAQMPWINPKQSKRDLLYLPNAFVTIALSRDKGSGSVKIDSNGNARLYYPLAQHDRNSLVEGSEMLVRLSAAVGAEKIVSSVIPLEGIVELPNADTHEEARRETIDSYIEKIVNAGVTADFRNTILSAHQMGTAKMSVKPGQGVCKDTGELHELNDLYVADTSLFPTPSGANPMITCLALCYDIAKRLKLKILSDMGIDRLQQNSKL